MKHKHAEIIKEFVDGINCQYFQCEKWWDIEYITQFEMFDDVRIKPEPKPDVVRFIGVTLDFVSKLTLCKYDGDNLKLTYDGETGKLKSAEVIK
jgi:hypothetical protein